MVDSIPPRVGLRGTAVTRRSPSSKRVTPTDRAEYQPPPRPHYSFVPSPEVLQELIDRALAALSKGIFWDRGSIINILL